MSLDFSLVEERCVGVFDSNITHNLIEMAVQTGVYYPLWHPEIIGAHKAKDIIPFLEAGLRILTSDPVGFDKYSAENGWGTFDDFFNWLADVLQACKEHPDADIDVSL